MNHEVITAIITDNGKIPYGRGITPNPYESQQTEWQRRNSNAEVIKLIDDKIHSLFEPRFITVPETSECLAALVTMTDSRRILEIGTCTGFGTLHMLKAVYGKPGAYVVSVDARPAHDKEFWARKEFDGILYHVEGWTPEILSTLDKSEPFDFVFVDSDHSIEHTEKELVKLWDLTKSGTVICFHDVPMWQSKDNQHPPPIYHYLYQKVAVGHLHGVILPSCEQLDCLDVNGPGYDKRLNPGLGIFIRP
jgi:predicted O-methyltransferase YrrM